MTNFVANNHADIAVVCRIVSIRVEVRGLQNSCREHNLVCRGHVVRVHSLRSHQPLRLVHRLTLAGNQPVSIKRTGAAQVLEQVTGHQLQCGEVTPLIGVTDLGDKLRQLLQRLLTGCLSHPVQRLNRLAVRLQEVADQNQHLLLVRGREVHGHVLLANLLTQSLLDGAHAALPTLTNLLSAGEGLAVEVEALLNQLVVHERRTRTQNSPHSPQLPAHQRDGGEQLSRTLKEGRLSHNNLTQGLRVGTQSQQPLREREAGELLVQLGRLVRVVGRLRVAVLHDVPVQASQLRLVSEHQLSRLLRGEAEALSQTGQLEHAGNMLNIRRACSLVLLFTVVGFIRQAQTRLVQEERVILRVLRVVAGVPGEQLRQTRTRQQRQGYSQVGGGCRVQDRGDLLQQRLQAVRLNLFNIHEGVVQRANTGLRLLLRDLLHQLTHVLLCVIAEGVQAAVFGAIRRDFVSGKPLTVDVAEEIVARLDGFIHPFFSDSRVSSHGSILGS